MKHLTLVILLLAITTQLVPAQAATWDPDQSHSEVDFSILHMSLSNVHGRFGNIAGTLFLDQADVTKSSVKITVDVNSVDSGLGARDSILKSESFFNTDKYPTATFVSTKVEKSSNGLDVTGNLTLHGVTKPVVLHVEGPTGPVTGMDHKPHAGFSAETAIDRLAFGIGNGFPNSIVGDSVKLSIDLEVVKQ